MPLTAVYIKIIILEKSKVRVLLVEDSAFQRKLMARRIQSVGIVSNGSWEVVQCEDGEKACAAVDEAVDTKEKFDVVVVDQTLSSDPNKMEGHEVSVTQPCITFIHLVIPF